MRRLSKTMTLVGTTALTCAVALTAHAHDSAAPATTNYVAPLFERRVPLNADVYHAMLDAKLAKIAAVANATRAKVAGIPGDEVLSGIERRVARVRLARAAKLDATLDALPASGMYAPTAAQRARIATIRADLAAIVAKLTRLLANESAPVTPPKLTTRTDKTEAVVGTTEWWRKGCRGWDGRESGDRDGWDGRESWDRHGWDGDRDWDGWRDSAWRG